MRRGKVFLNITLYGTLDMTIKDPKNYVEEAIKAIEENFKEQFCDKYFEDWHTDYLKMTGMETEVNGVVFEKEEDDGY